MDESQLAGALAFCRLVLNQPELRIDDICKANVVNRIIADFDKRPTLKQCEPNPNVSYKLRVVHTKAILFLKSMSERVGSREFLDRLKKNRLKKCIFRTANFRWSNYFSDIRYCNYFLYQSISRIS